LKRLLVGPHAVGEGLRAAPAQIAVVYLEPGSGAELAALARSRNVAVQERSRAELEGLASRAPHAPPHQGVLAIAGEYSYCSLDELLDRAGPAPLLVALDQIQDPHNFGAIVRSAVAFGASGVITLKDRAAPVTAVVVRASAGATERTHIARVTNLARALADLRERELEVIGLAAEGTVELSALPYPPAGRVLVVGSEGDGLRRLVRAGCDHLARVPMAGPMESLNASVAAGIALYECVRNRETHAR
jgi:23S rRNA (guanosine2251-2'-O)-methyltransferase